MCSVLCALRGAIGSFLTSSFVGGQTKPQHAGIFMPDQRPIFLHVLVKMFGKLIFIHQRNSTCINPKCTTGAQLNLGLVFTGL